MSVTVPTRQLSDSIANRQARPLNGVEVREALEKHVFSLTDQIMTKNDSKSDAMLHQIEQVSSSLRAELAKHSQLSRVNLSYPKVGWSIKIRLEELEDLSRIINGEIELDLQRNLRLNIRFGLSGVGNVISTIEDERIPTDTPDLLRKDFKLPITTDVIGPDGLVKKVDLSNIERRAARTADVGSGAVDRKSISVYGEVEEVIDGEITKIPVMVEKLASGGEEGLEVVLPSQLPEITLDDVVATPPEPPKAELSYPLPPPNSMANKTRPNVKIRR
jgi:hypothetical protein